MTLNFTSYSKVRSDDDFGSMGWDRGTENCGNPCWLNWEKNDSYENGGGRDWTDPIDLLPADPFGMEMTSNLAAAIVGWFEDLGVNSGDCSVYCWDGDYQNAAGDWFGDGFFEVSGYGVQDGDGVVPYFLGAEETLSSSEPEEGLPHEALMLSLGYFQDDDAPSGCFLGAEETPSSSEPEEGLPHEALLLSLGFVQDDDGAFGCPSSSEPEEGLPHEALLLSLGFVQDDAGAFGCFLGTEETPSSSEREEGVPHEALMLSLGYFQDDDGAIGCFFGAEETQSSSELEEGLPHEALFLSPGYAQNDDGAFGCFLGAEETPSSSDPEEGLPHVALMLSLGYLGVQDLLSVGMVCRSFCSAVQNDPLLWRCIHIDSPLSEKITDDALLRLTLRAQGSLQCLSLVGCLRITDEGLKKVLESNPRLQKLSISGCLRLNMEGVISNLKAFKSSGVTGIKHLKLGRLFSVSPEQYEELQMLLGGDEMRQPKLSKPRFYHCAISSIACEDDRSLDIEMCPGCHKVKLVFDCPSESCQGKEPEKCRACVFCIGRCVQCGRCVNDCQFEETFTFDFLCSGCGGKEKVAELLQYAFVTQAETSLQDGLLACDMRMRIGSIQ